jgi:hypothetical protein
LGSVSGCNIKCTHCSRRYECVCRVLEPVGRVSRGGRVIWKRENFATGSPQNVCVGVHAYTYLYPHGTTTPRPGPQHPNVCNVYVHAVYASRNQFKPGVRFVVFYLFYFIFFFFFYLPRRDQQRTIVLGPGRLIITIIIVVMKTIIITIVM